MALSHLSEQLAHLEQGLALSDADMIVALEIDSRTMSRWRNDASFPQREARKRLDRLVTLQGKLQDTFSDEEAVRAWMRTESRYLGGLTPAEVIRAGRLDRAEAALEALASGAFI